MSLDLDIDDGDIVDCGKRDELLVWLLRRALALLDRNPDSEYDRVTGSVGVTVPAFDGALYSVSPSLRCDVARRSELDITEFEHSSTQLHGRAGGALVAFFEVDRSE